MSIANRAEATLERQGQPFTITLALARNAYGDKSDQVFEKGAQVQVNARFTPEYTRTDETITATALGYISGAALDISKPREQAGIYAPLIGDKVHIGDDLFAITSIKPVIARGGVVALYNIEAKLS